MLNAEVKAEWLRTGARWNHVLKRLRQLSAK